MPCDTDNEDTKRFADFLNRVKIEDDLDYYDFINLDIKAENLRMNVKRNILNDDNYLINIYGMDIPVSLSVPRLKLDSKWNCKILNSKFTDHDVKDFYDSYKDYSN